MTPIEYIRKSIFRVSQVAFGEIAGTTQASVSRWERSELEPGYSEMERIRAAALDRGIAWNDRLFFDEPPAPAAPDQRGAA